MRLNISIEQATQRLASLRHKTFQKALQTQWQVTPEGDVAAHSALWLFCWAKTGMNCQDAAGDARLMLNDFFLITYADFDARVPHEYARVNRYTASPDI